MFPVMDIRTADTSVVYGDEDIVGRSQFRLWLLCEGNIEWFVEDEGEVLWQKMLAVVLMFVMESKVKWGRRGYICGFCHCCEV